jgi:hypothetical protein
MVFMARKIHKVASMKTEAALRKWAGALPGAEAGVACEGTTLESTTFGVKKKVFLFLRPVDARLELRFKLDGSQAAAKTLSKAQPKLCTVGAGGWTKLSFIEKEAPAMTLLKKWIGESHALVSA